MVIINKACMFVWCQNGESALHHAIRAGHYLVLEELIRVLFQMKSKAVARLVINMPTDVSNRKSQSF